MVYVVRSEEEEEEEEEEGTEVRFTYRRPDYLYHEGQGVES